jgi:hypothetical protein
MSEFVGDFSGGGFGGGGFGGGDFDWGGGFSSFGTTAEPGGDSWDLGSTGGLGDSGGGDAWDIGGFDAPEAARWDVTQPERGFFDRLGTWASSEKGEKTISAIGSAAGGLGKMLGDKTAAQPWPAMGGGGGQGAESRGSAPSNLGALIQALLAKRQAQTTAYLKPGSMEPRAMSGLLGSG